MTRLDSKLLFALALLVCTPFLFARTSWLATAFVCVLSVLITVAPVMKATKLLGFATVLLPVFGSGSLLFCLAIYLLRHATLAKVSNPYAWNAFTLFCLLLFISALATGIVDFELVSVWKLGGFDALLAYCSVSPPLWTRALEHAVRFSCCLWLWSYFVEQQEARLVFLRGLFYGVICSLPIIALQIFQPELLSFANMGRYWVSINRFSGTFSDPNAFGLAVFFIVPLLATLYLSTRSVTSDARSTTHRFLLCVVSASICFLALYSGSRSMFVGFGLLCFFLTYFYHRSWALLLAFFFLMIPLGLDFFRELAPALLSSFVDTLPVSLSRIIDSLSVTYLAQAFHSRLVFWKIAFFVWIDNFFFGVGLESFPSYVTEYAKLLNLGLGSWIDNANSFYLGVLAELGLVGALIFAVGLVRTRSLDSADSLLGNQAASVFILRSTVCAFVGLLFLGPHLVFDEIAVLFAVTASGVMTSSRLSTRTNFSKYSFATICFATIISLSLMSSIYRYKQRGWYQFEDNRNGTMASWSQPEAIVSLPCINGLSTLRLKHPLASKVSKKTFVVLNKQRILVLSDTEQHDFEFECIGESDSIEIVAQNPFIPKEIGLSNDPRALGVQRILK